LAEYDAQVRSHLEAFKATIESGREALNALLLINGGAVVALLGFVGAMASKTNGMAVAASMRAPLLRFGTGVLLGALAFGMRYLAQAFYASDMNRWGHAFNALSISLAIAGYVVFGWGKRRHRGKNTVGQHPSAPVGIATANRPKWRAPLPCRTRQLLSGESPDARRSRQCAQD
jgi:hypothetical protein